MSDGLIVFLCYAPWFVLIAFCASLVTFAVLLLTLVLLKGVTWTAGLLYRPFARRN